MQTERALHGKIAARTRQVAYDSDNPPSASQVEDARRVLQYEPEGRQWPKERRAALFEAFLITKGADVEVSIVESGGQGYASTRDYRFRYQTEVIQIGVRKTFDRWANSVDFVVEPLPASEAGCEAVLAALAQAVARNLRKGMACWDSYDLLPLVRKYRSTLRRENR